MRQIGFDRDISIALVGAFAAKEVVVTQLAIATRTEEDEASGNKSLREILATELPAPSLLPLRYIQSARC